MVDRPNLHADAYGAEPESADGFTPLLVVKNPRRSVWPWIWLGFLLLGISVLLWLVYQITNIYSLGQATLDPDRPTIAESSPSADTPPESPTSESPDPAAETPSKVTDSSATESPTNDTPPTDKPPADTSSADTDRTATVPPEDSPPEHSPQGDASTAADPAQSRAEPSDAAVSSEPAAPEANPAAEPPAEAAASSDTGSEGTVEPAANKSPPPPFTAKRADDQRARENVRPIIEQVRSSLSKQDLMAAGRQLSGLKQLSLTPDEALLVERLRSAQFHLQRFWQGVERGRQKLRVGDRLTIGRQPEKIVQLDTGSIRLESADGTERTLPFGLHTYDPYLVAAVARRDLQSQGAPFLLALASFWATDRTGDPRMARVLFQAAEQQGLPVGSLSREAAWTTATDPTATDPTATDPTAPDGQPSDNRIPVPPRRELTEARQQIKTTYGNRFTQLDPAGQMQMAQEMLETAAAPDQPEAQRYALLEQVVKIGCHLGSVDTAFAAVDAMADRYAIPVSPLTYAQTWERAYAKVEDDQGRRAAISQAVRMSENLLAHQHPTVALALIETAQAKLLTVPDDGLLVQLDQLRQQAKANEAQAKNRAKK
ncbi:MAG: hypothetical protein U0795_24470 [Pirellulales bacterium]